MKLGKYTVTIVTTPGAYVVIGGQGSNTADSSGKAIFYLKKGNYSYVISLSGYDEKSGTFSVSKNQQFSLYLNKTSKTVFLLHLDHSTIDEMGHIGKDVGSGVYFDSGKFNNCINLDRGDGVHFDDAGFGDIINNNQWTLEFWCYPLTSGLINSYMISSWYSGKYQFAIHGGWSSGTLKPQMEIRMNGGISGRGGACSESMGLNTWNHIAFVRNGTSLLGYVNGRGGSLVGSSPINNMTSSVSYLDIGYKADTGDHKSGFMLDEIRISKVARYLSNFTPSQSPFVVD